MEATRTTAEAVELCRRGQREGFRLLYELHANAVYSLALRYSGNEAAARDIAQEVFLKLFARIREFRGEARFESWLFRLVVNACMDERRRTRRLVALEEVEMRAVESPARAAQQAALSAAVQEAVLRLKPHLRMAILLRHMQGLSYDEMATAMGCGKGTVASRLNRAHQELAGLLGHLREAANDV